MQYFMKYQYFPKFKINHQINLHEILSIAHHDTVASSHLASEESAFRT